MRKILQGGESIKYASSVTIFVGKKHSPEEKRKERRKKLERIFKQN